MSGFGGPYVSPFLLEILSTRSGAPAFPVAAGSLTANTGQTVSCSRVASAYCLGNDGLLHLLGANTVRVEPLGLLVEGAATNNLLESVQVGKGGSGNPWFNVSQGVSTPVVTLNSTDVLDPAGGSAASKVVLAATTTTEQYSLVYQQMSGGAVETDSIYLRCATGQSATLYLLSFEGPGTYIACNVTDSWQRFIFPKGAASKGYLGFGSDTRAAGAASPTMAACTVYAWGAQGETTAFPTSLIATTGATATRDADLVTVANPLASLGQPVSTWRWGLTGTPLHLWSDAADGAPWVLLNIGNNAGASNARLLNSTTSNLTFDENAVSGVVTTSGVFSGSTTTAAGGTVAGGQMNTIPVGTPVAYSSIATMPATMGIGHATDLSTFGVWGHLTDIFVNNS